jgi:hypothetical protein
MPRSKYNSDSEKLRYKTDDTFREKRKTRSLKEYHENKNSALWPSMQRKKRSYYQDNREELLARSNERYRADKRKLAEASVQKFKDIASGKIKRPKKKRGARKMFNGESLPDICKRLGLPLGRIKRRIYHYKIPFEEALTMERPRNHKLIEYKGKKNTLRGWCRVLGLKYPTVYMQVMYQKMSYVEAFTMTPRKPGRPKKAPRLEAL